jgi:adenosine/AMP kinase
LAPVNVEDVNAFIELAKKEVDLSEEDSMKKVFEILASKINPLVLGAVHRSREQIAFLASTLMKYHTTDEERIKKCIGTLTRQRFSHTYIINRREAKEVLGLHIIEPDEKLTDLIINLFNAYNDIIMMDKPYHPEVVLGGDNVKIADFNRGIIESVDLTHVFRTKKEVKRVEVTQPGIPHPVVGYQERVLQEEWTEDNNI